MKYSKEQIADQDHHTSYPIRFERLYNHFHQFVDKAGIKKGRVVEIGGRDNPIGKKFDSKKFDYVSFDLEKSSDDVIVADITHCPQVESEFCDIVYSVDVFEHINRPWRAASEITRILKPGGIVYTSTLFSWRYHPCPIDYWRYTPDCLAFLFENLNTLDAGFDKVERRRNIVGMHKNKIEEDSFGGWRENWRVFHVGQKPK